MTTVMVFGTFDILHPGHVYLLNEAKKLGDRLVVVIALDDTVKKVKNFFPNNDEQTRKKNIESLDIADKVVLGNKIDKYQIIREENPNIIALGYDQKDFTDKLQENFKDIKIIRLEPHQADKYKSSKFR